MGEKYWAFALSGADTGVVTQYQGRRLPGPVTQTQNDLTWAQDSNGDLYIQSSITTLDPGQSYQAQKRTDQNVDVHGNITQVYQYAFNSLTSPARIYTYQYLTPNTTYHIYDRLTQVSVSWGLGTTWTMVTNAYANYTDGTPSTGPPLWDSTYAASSPRSNMSSSTAPGSQSTVQLQPARCDDHQLHKRRFDNNNAIQHKWLRGSIASHNRNCVRNAQLDYLPRSDECDGAER